MFGVLFAQLRTSTLIGKVYMDSQFLNNQKCIHFLFSMAARHNAPPRKYNTIQKRRYNAPTELIVKCRYWITLVSKFRNLV